MVKVGDYIFSDYDNGEIVNGEVVKVRDIDGRILVTVKASQGYRSIYLDKCVGFSVVDRESPAVPL